MASCVGMPSAKVPEIRFRKTSRTDPTAKARSDADGATPVNRPTPLQMDGLPWPPPTHETNGRDIDRCGLRVQMECKRSGLLGTAFQAVTGGTRLRRGPTPAAVTNRQPSCASMMLGVLSGKPVMTAASAVPASRGPVPCHPREDPRLKEACGGLSSMNVATALAARPREP